jgi:hypothetical protein
LFKAFGAILVIAGVLYSVWAALSHRKLSQPPRSSANQNSASLEPRAQGLKFLGLTNNLPAIALILTGGVLLFTQIETF